MKKTKKSDPKSAMSGTTGKGQKLTYDKLRIVVMDTIQKSKTQTWSARQLLKKRRVANGKRDIVRLLDGLVKQGKRSLADDGMYSSLMEPKMSKQAVVPAQAVSHDAVQGTVDMTRSGAAYVIVDGMEEDVYVPPRHLGGAMNRDKVEIEIISNRRGKKPEGRIVKVVKRAIEHVI